MQRQSLRYAHGQHRSSGMHERKASSRKSAKTRQRKRGADLRNGLLLEVAVVVIGIALLRPTLLEKVGGFFANRSAAPTNFSPADFQGGEF